MEKLSYCERDYATRLENYIESEARSRALYAALACRMGGRAGAVLRSMSADEGRHLRAMQTEYYLLTGDSLACVRPDISGDSQELLRRAYAVELAAAEGYAAEAEKHTDGALRALFLAQSRDERCHRHRIKMLLGSALGLDGG